MKQGRTIDIHAAAGLAGCLRESLAYRALIASERVYRVALTTMPKENS